MRKICILFILIKTLNMSSQESYKVYETKELQKIVFKEGNIKVYKQIESNYSLVYKLKNGKFALISQLGKFSILFDSEESLDAMVNIGKYPVGLETDSFYEENKALVLNLEQGIEVFMSNFFKRININPIPLKSDDDQHLINLSKVINERITNSEFYYEDLMLLDLFMMNFTINREKDLLEWELRPEYTLNIYYCPVVRKKGSIPLRIAYSKKITDSIDTSGKIDLLDIFRWQISDVYDLFLSPEHAHFIKTGELPLGFKN